MEPLRISVDEVKKRLDRGEPILFIDTRSPGAWEDSNSKIPGALRIHYADLEQHLAELPHDQITVTYCT